MHSDYTIFGQRWVGVEGAASVVAAEWCGYEVGTVFGVDLGAGVVATQVVGDRLTDGPRQVLGSGAGEPVVGADDHRYQADPALIRAEGSRS